MCNLLRQYWLPAIKSDELPEPDGAPLRVRLLGEDPIGFRSTTCEVGLIRTIARTAERPCSSAATKSRASAASATGGSTTSMVSASTCAMNPPKPTSKRRSRRRRIRGVEDDGAGRQGVDRGPAGVDPLLAPGPHPPPTTNNSPRPSPATAASTCSASTNSPTLPSMPRRRTWIRQIVTRSQPLSVSRSRTVSRSEKQSRSADRLSVSQPVRNSCGGRAYRSLLDAS
jgi:hypothetical protein